MFARCLPAPPALLVCALLVCAPLLPLTAFTAEPGGIVVSRAWARATPPGTTVGAAYLTIANHGGKADTLLSVSSAVAAMTELHRTAISQGLSTMRPAGELNIAPGQTIKVEPGGLHIMLMGLKQPLVEGARFPLQLNFRTAGIVSIQVPVQSLTGSSREHHAEP